MMSSKVVYIDDEMHRIPLWFSRGQCFLCSWAGSFVFESSATALNC